MKTLEQLVNDKLAQWHEESILQAARYLAEGAKPQLVQFPTSLEIVRITGKDNCQCEISCAQLLELQSNNFKVRV